MKVLVLIETSAPICKPCYVEDSEAVLLTDDVYRCRDFRQPAQFGTIYPARRGQDDR